MRRFTYILLSIAAVYTVMAGEGFTTAKSIFVEKVFSAGDPAEAVSLRAQIEALRAELLHARLGIDRGKTQKELPAKIYSLYPFSDKSLVTVNVGKAQGVREGMPVVIERTLLLGRVRSVYEGTSTVQTVFDPKFQIPVRTGEEEADALYVGGLTPALRLIEAKSGVMSGDFVLSASADLPYGLVLGSVHEVVEKGLLKEATIRPSFEMKFVRNASVILR